MATQKEASNPRSTQARNRTNTESKAHAVFTRPPIYDGICDACSPATLCRLQKVSAAARAAVQHYGTRTFSANKRLARFFDDTPAFRAIQAWHVALSDLDIYVFQQEACDIGAWLADAGYTFRGGNKDETFDIFSARVKSTGWSDVDTLDIPPGYGVDRGIAAYLRFVKGGPPLRQPETLALCQKLRVDTAPQEDPAGTEVQIIACDEAPLAVILRFHSTVVLNFFSWKSAYSLYPLATFEERRTLVLREAVEEPVEKYAERGFTPLWDDWEQGKSLRRGDRWVGDCNTWFLPLDTTGVDAPGGSPTELNLNGWTLKRRMGLEKTYASRGSHEDEDLISEQEIELHSAAIEFDTVGPGRPWRLSKTYTVPYDFYKTVSELNTIYKTLGPHRHIALDQADKVGRDGRLQMYKMAVILLHDGSLQARLLNLMLDPPSPPTLEEYIEHYS